MGDRSSSNNKPPGHILGRGFQLAKLTAKLGARAAGHSLEKLLKSGNSPENLKKYLSLQVASLAKDLGQLKGSVMKAGQLLSTYGEHFLPPEVNDILKSLQHQAPPVEWSEIRKVLEKELGPQRLGLLEIDPKPFAAASLGQVHKARVLASGENLALKVQYPGVDRAVETDLTFLKMIFQLTDLFPSGFRSQSVMEEIKKMLMQELDYQQEAHQTKWFYEKAKSFDRIDVPKVYDEFCSPVILATEFIDSLPAGDPQILHWPQHLRNDIAQLFLHVYMSELFQWGRVQTDPHFGNYRLRLDDKGQARLVLLDFGAVRAISPEFQSSYQTMVRGAFQRKAQEVFLGGQALGFLKEDDPDELRQIFLDLCYLITEPFALPLDPLKHSLPTNPFMSSNGEYDWGKSDLPQRVARQGALMISQFRFRTPPQEVIFIDRKLGGTFTFLNRLGAVINARPLLESYLEPL